ncbi:MAG: tetratricopeptide repeat protein [Bacteroidales bacterium]|nr:tetratricopeptide repeat protein [Bacteroidales bacterium]
MIIKHKKIIYILIILVLGINNITFCRDTLVYDNIIHFSDTLINTEKVDFLNKQAIKFKGVSPGKMIEYGKQALELSEDIKYQDGKAKALENIGLGYFALSDYHNALKLYLRSLKIYESINNNTGISYCLINIGNVYLRLTNYEKALEFYNKSLLLNKEIGNKKEIAVILNNIGVTYFNLEKNELSLEYHQRSLRIRKEIGDTIGISYSMNNIGCAHYNLNNYNKALDYYLIALLIKKKMGTKKEIAVSLFNIGETYMKLSNFTKSSIYLERALQLSKETNIKRLIQSIYDVYSQLHSLNNNYKEAYEYHILYSKTKDSIYNEESSEQIAKMQTIYETEKKEKEIELLNKEKKIQNSELERQKIIVLSVICFSILILILVFVIYNRFREKKNANKLLSQQNEEIENKNIILNQQKEELIAQAEDLQKLSIVASETDNAVIIMDAKGNIEWINEGFTRIYGYNYEQLIKKKGRNIVEGSANPNVVDVVNTCLKDKKTIVYETLDTSKFGENIWAQTTLTPIMDDKGNITKLVAIDSNITKLKNAEKEISSQKEEIIDSIIYAKRIQTAIFPSDESVRELFNDYFILNKPKGIVSGDFYWFSKINNKIVIAVADCTGHGVPGAFMSMLGVTMLNKIVNEKSIIKPNEILDQLRANIIVSLHQTGKSGEANDGMDISLITIDKKNNSLEYSGANNSAYLFRNNELAEIFADKMPIGIYSEIEISFSCQKMSIQTGDIIYLFTDGYADQFGGLKNKKFLYKHFKNLLKEIHNLPMNEQETKLFKTHRKWKDNNEQVDDILIMGIKI